jgi:DDE_Tnp_1-associated
MSIPSQATTTSPTALIETHFGRLEDPRALHSIEHKLIDIVIITFLELPHGIPSADTFIRVFARLKPEALQCCFMGWMEAVHQATAGELLNVDGKTLRGAKEAGNSRSFIHMVSVWSASHHLVLGQKKVSEKSNEITAIPPLLELLALQDCLVSIDVMGCQT